MATWRLQSATYCRPNSSALHTPPGGGFFRFADGTMKCRRSPANEEINKEMVNAVVGWPVALGAVPSQLTDFLFFFNKKREKLHTQRNESGLPAPPKWTYHFFSKKKKKNFILKMKRERGTTASGKPQGGPFSLSIPPLLSDWQVISAFRCRRKRFSFQRLTHSSRKKSGRSKLVPFLAARLFAVVVAVVVVAHHRRNWNSRLLQLAILFDIFKI